MPEHDTDFVEWTREMQIADDVSGLALDRAPGIVRDESRLRKFSRVFFEFLDETGRRIKRDGLGLDDQARLRRSVTLESGEHGKAA